MPKHRTSSTFFSLVFSIASLAMIGLAVHWLSPDMSDAAPPPGPAAVPVRAASVGQRDVPVIVQAIGNVRSLRSVDIRPQVDGLLLDVPVSEGQFVRQGELLAQIDDRGILAVLQQARAERDMAQAQLTSANGDLARYRALASGQAISKQILDQQTALVAQLRAGLHSRDAIVTANEVQLSYTRIQSPTDGHVGIRNIHPGSYVRAGDAQPLFSVVQLDPIGIESALPQAMLGQLQALLGDASQTAASLRAYASDSGTLLSEGQLSLIDNRVSNATGTVRIKGTFANPQGALWPDQSVVINLQTDTLSNALVVPQRALRQGQETTFVWRITEDKAAPQPVQVTYADASIAVVTGLQPGDLIVEDGYSRLRPGATVQILNAAETASLSDGGAAF
jgi:RND family efflux transporter MFP subunit